MSVFVGIFGAESGGDVADKTSYGSLPMGGSKGDRAVTDEQAQWVFSGEVWIPNFAGLDTSSLSRVAYMNPDEGQTEDDAITSGPWYDRSSGGTITWTAGSYVELANGAGAGDATSLAHNITYKDLVIARISITAVTGTQDSHVAFSMRDGSRDCSVSYVSGTLGDVKFHNNNSAVGGGDAFTPTGDYVWVIWDRDQDIATLLDTNGEMMCNSQTADFATTTGTYVHIVCGGTSGAAGQRAKNIQVFTADKL